MLNKNTRAAADAPGAANAALFSIKPPQADEENRKRGRRRPSFGSVRLEEQDSLPPAPSAAPAAAASTAYGQADAAPSSSAPSAPSAPPASPKTADVLNLGGQSGQGTQPAAAGARAHAGANAETRAHTSVHNPGLTVKTQKRMALTIAVPSPMSAPSAGLSSRIPLSPQSARSPLSPTANPDPAFNRIRRQSVNFTPQEPLDALSVALEGALMIVYTEQDLESGRLGGVRTMPPKLHVRLDPGDHMRLLWGVDDGPGEPRAVDIRLVREVTRWLTREERKALGIASKAAFTVVYANEPGQTAPEHRLLLVAQSRRDLDVWSAALAELARVAGATCSLGDDTPVLLQDLLIAVDQHKDVGDFTELLHDHFIRNVHFVAPEMSPELSAAGVNVPQRSADDSAILQSSTGHASPRPGLRTINALTFLKRGAQFYKYGRSGSPHYRQFYLRDDNAAIVWLSQFKRASNTEVRLDAVDSIVVGHNTDVFLSHEAPVELEEASFSILYHHKGKKRSLDLMATNSNQYEIWLAAVKALVRIAKLQHTDQLSQLKEVKVEVHLQRTPKDYLSTIERLT